MQQTIQELKRCEAPDLIGGLTLTQIARHPLNKRAEIALKAVREADLETLRGLGSTPDYWCEKEPRSRTKYFRRYLLDASYPFNEFGVVSRQGNTAVLGVSEDYSQVDALLPVFRLLLERGFQAGRNNWRGDLASMILNQGLRHGVKEPWRLRYAETLVEFAQGEMKETLVGWLQAAGGYDWISDGGYRRYDRLRMKAGLAPLEPYQWLKRLIRYANCCDQHDPGVYDRVFEELVNVGARMSPEVIRAYQMSAPLRIGDSRFYSQWLPRLDSLNAVTWRESYGPGDLEVLDRQPRDGRGSDEYRSKCYEPAYRWLAEKGEINPP